MNAGRFGPQTGDCLRLPRLAGALKRNPSPVPTGVQLARRRAGVAEVWLADYRNRDRVEKLFDSLKNEDGQRRLRTGVDANAEGRLFLAFAALVLRAAVEEKMRKAGRLRKMTVAERLAQTRKIRAVTTLSGRRFLLEIPRRTRDVLGGLSIPLPT